MYERKSVEREVHILQKGKKQRVSGDWESEAPIHRQPLRDANLTYQGQW